MSCVRAGAHVVCGVFMCTTVCTSVLLDAQVCVYIHVCLCMCVCLLLQACALL